MAVSHTLGHRQGRAEQLQSTGDGWILEFNGTRKRERRTTSRERTCLVDKDEMDDQDKDDEQRYHVTGRLDQEESRNWIEAALPAQ